MSFLLVGMYSLIMGDLYFLLVYTYTFIDFACTEVFTHHISSHHPHTHLDLTGCLVWLIRTSQFIRYG